MPMKENFMVLRYTKILRIPKAKGTTNLTLDGTEKLIEVVNAWSEWNHNTLRSLIDVPPPPINFAKNFHPGNSCSTHPALIKFQKKFQPGYLKICSSKQTSSILLLNFFINRFSTDFQYKFCSNFLQILRTEKYKTCKWENLGT